VGGWHGRIDAPATRVASMEASLRRRESRHIALTYRDRALFQRAGRQRANVHKTGSAATVVGSRFISDNNADNDRT
jgi:hypothetical protein